jgi:hypothetical protein
MLNQFAKFHQNRHEVHAKRWNYREASGAVVFGAKDKAIVGKSLPEV